ncbi:hypothetical protein LAZ67_17002145 [Cordylochernes scorpioides]|uniref:Uncharacterized protein n=1 Tax=Cordylochernes scorpioides TaxID=51811 RepID=A0ABY6LF66_9ARAC|nr:hypothetical protein LAZ67_17002145 [Cordylochernes scorpioides]
MWKVSDNGLAFVFVIESEKKTLKDMFRDPLTQVPKTTTDPLTQVPKTTTDPLTQVPKTTTDPLTQVPKTTTDSLTQVPKTTTDPLTQVPKTTTDPLTQVPKTTTDPLSQVPKTTTDPLTQVPKTTTDQLTQVPKTTTDPLTQEGSTDVNSYTPGITAHVYKFHINSISENTSTSSISTPSVKVSNQNRVLTQILSVNNNELIHVYKFHINSISENTSTSSISTSSVKDYFIGKRNVIYERAKFNRRSQGETEPVEEFITNLYVLAETCSYGILKEEMIRDRLVVGVKNFNLSEKLQLESELTLEKAIQIVRQSESVKNQQKEIRQDTEDRNVDVIEVGKVKYTDTKYCRKCKLNKEEIGLPCHRLCKTCWIGHRSAAILERQLDNFQRYDLEADT